ncbi:MAG: lysophospholipid acyltransferase family protein [Alphaproteobacteria bacterium]|jgi:lyso-ornithine lipid O-acyltransferase|nr:1-acyl-sn-glycerol-3-phosphate acyltransferase [Rhodospirillaceae bacterium]MDG2482468.1 lysophospholipid acyltransferase family protein [Alphaproteobacteria bacterium]MBT6203315.1 1-acyl-sn-glycerol-3-phosphate acyltransferase [Rhodospirillaceae bacterium]MBT6510131.1 1-acyl-sn-glycerol-3-phosphate acyltransferase [Rhodospirillaceae bacterium]MBT7613096.1 1-acyl-sn-glycerol-3-phosphate acyltransferase [Rhodospirillaceae bacterium]
MIFVALIRALIYVGFTLVCLPIQVVLVVFGAKASHAFPQFYHRIVLRVMGIKLDIRGRPSRKRPCIYVSNHSSYLDIEILGALIRGSFVAKSEIGDWPFFGTLAKLQRTVFVDRRRSQAGKHKTAIEERLEAGERLILFPEGTTSDGNRVLPFKRALFATAQQKVGGNPVMVQPISIAYSGFSNLPMDRDMRPVYAWYGDMDLLPHVWDMLKAGTATVVVQFHPTLTIEEVGDDRRALAEYCHTVVNDGVMAALTGRLPPRRQRGLGRFKKARAN